MSLRVALLGVAHVHAGSYAHALRSAQGAHLAGVWDEVPARGSDFAAQWETTTWSTLDAALDGCDAVIIAAENLRHGVLIEAACAAGKPVLCEKPLAASRSEADRIRAAFETSGVLGMTAFPCPFSPTFQRVQARLKSGEIGKIVGISATNRGTCPGGWFVDPELAGGGAMMDHTVHVADLLCRLLGSAPIQVRASLNNRMYEGEVEDCALLMMDYPDGVFASLDASWSRRPTFRTWGDVTFNLVGDVGVIEATLFDQLLNLSTSGTRTQSVAGYGSNLDALMVQEFVNAIREQRPPMVTWQDGLAASEVALRGYESLMSVGSA